MRRRKVYVGVNVDVDREGRVLPRTITWEDGRRFEINRVGRIVQAASPYFGGCGLRYTVKILGRETFLFQEEKRWFVEARE